MENVLHELCHAVTLQASKISWYKEGERCVTLLLSNAISKLSPVEARDNELLTLAVELLVLRRLGFRFHTTQFLYNVLRTQMFTSKWKKAPKRPKDPPRAEYMPAREAISRIMDLKMSRKARMIARRAMQTIHVWYRFFVMQNRET